MTQTKTVKILFSFKWNNLFCHIASSLECYALRPSYGFLLLHDKNPFWKKSLSGQLKPHVNEVHFPDSQTGLSTLHLVSSSKVLKTKIKMSTKIGLHKRTFHNGGNAKYNNY